MKHKILIASLAGILLACASPAFALTQAEKDALALQIAQQITALQAQVSQLQAQQNNNTNYNNNYNTNYNSTYNNNGSVYYPTNTNWCHAFNTNLGYANSGSAEVIYLHTALQKEGINYGSDSATVFASATANAVAVFQARNGISATGFVGPITRARLNQVYGCAQGVISSAPINLIYPNGGQTLYVGDTPRISWSTSGLTSSDKVKITVYMPQDPYLNVKTIASSVAADQGYYDWNITANNLPSTSFPLYLRIKLELTSKNTKFSTASVSDFLVNSVSNTQTSSISLTYPNGGQTLYVGDSARIAWSSYGLSSSDRVAISVYSPINPNANVKTITSSVTASQGYYDWDITNNNLPSTSFPVSLRVKIEVVGKNISTSSSSSFTVNSATNQGLASISIVYPVGGETLAVGNTPRITWNTTGFSSADRVTITVYSSANPYLNVKTITTSAPATQGYYDWAITKTNVPAFGSGLKIKVESVNKNIMATTPGEFTVTAPPAN